MAKSERDQYEPEWVVQFAPESVVHFAPESMVQFTPEYTLGRILYSFFATCKAHDINPRNWLQDTLDKIQSTKLPELYTLIPGFTDM